MLNLCAIIIEMRFPRPQISYRGVPIDITPSRPLAWAKIAPAVPGAVVNSTILKCDHNIWGRTYYKSAHTLPTLWKIARRAPYYESLISDAAVIERDLATVKIKKSGALRQAFNSRCPEKFINQLISPAVLPELNKKLDEYEYIKLVCTAAQIAHSSLDFLGWGGFTYNKLLSFSITGAPFAADAGALVHQRHKQIELWLCAGILDYFAPTHVERRAPAYYDRSYNRKYSPRFMGQLKASIDELLTPTAGEYTVLAPYATQRRGLDLYAVDEVSFNPRKEIKIHLNHLPEVQQMVTHWRKFHQELYVTGPGRRAPKEILCP